LRDAQQTSANSLFRGRHVPRCGWRRAGRDVERTPVHEIVNTTDRVGRSSKDKWAAAQTLMVHCGGLTKTVPDVGVYYTSADGWCS
jgi:hypothetical protein